MWQVFGASAQGTSHHKTGSPCQDAHGYHVTNEYVIVAVADGLGSAGKSLEGAGLAAKTAVEVLCHRIKNKMPSDSSGWTQVLTDTFIGVREALEKTAQASGSSLRDYHTTLIAVIVTNEWLAVGHIGDGAVVALFPGDAMETVSTPEQGEYVNEVTPITSPKALDLVRFAIFPAQVKAVALLTDGLQNLSINAATGKPFTPFFAPFFEAAVQEIDTADASIQLADFLSSDRVCAKTDDDKTLVIVGKVREQEIVFGDQGLKAGK